jgi:ribokinase
MYDLITIGDIKLDTFIVLSEASLKCTTTARGKRCLLCIEYGAKIPVKDFEPQIAGSAPNVAVGLARLGLKTAIFSMVGSDPTGHLAFARMKEEGVDTRYMKISKKVRSSYSVVITYKGDRTILGALQPHAFRLPKLGTTKWLYVSEIGAGNEDLFDAITQLVATKSLKLGFNPGAIQIQSGAKQLKPILQNTEVLFVNREEGQQLLRRRNHPDIRHLIHDLWKLGPSVVVVTEGKKGAYAFDGGKTWFVKPFRAKAIELTGAGDSFATGFLAALHYGKNLADCLRWGSANAASCVEHVGPQPGLLTKTNLLRSLRTNAKIVARHAE